MAECHPERVHVARGMCRQCYEADRRENGVRAECHPDRPYHGAGLCKACWSERNHEKRRGDPTYLGKRSTYCRIWNLKKAGVDVAGFDYESMFEAQGGLCAICHQSEKGQRLAVDHDHETLKIRALLCRACNQMLGRMNDDPDLLRRAAEYIEKHRVQGGVGA